MNTDTNIYLEWEVMAFTGDGALETKQLENVKGSRFHMQSLANDIAHQQPEGWRVRITNVKDHWDFYESDYVDFDQLLRRR